MNEVRLLPVADLHPNPKNPRSFLGDVSDLAGSVGLVGVQQPLAVVTDPAGGWMIVAGHRRHAAATIAGLDSVPCIVRDDLALEDPVGLLVFGLVENLARAELDPFDEAAAYHALLGQGLTQSEIARQVGVSAATVSARLRLLKLTASERRLVREGVLGLGEAYDLVKTPGRPRPARIESNNDRRLERTVDLLRKTASWLVTLTDRPDFDQVDRAASLLNASANLLASTIPGHDPDSPPGVMRGRLRCETCHHPIADHSAVGVCPQDGAA